MKENLIGTRYLYQKSGLLYESNHVQVYDGVDNTNKERVHIKLVDESGFEMLNNNSNSSEKDAISRAGIELHRSQLKQLRQMQTSNERRKYTTKIIDVVSVSNTSTAFVLQSTRWGSLSEFLIGNNYLDELDSLLVMKSVIMGLIEISQESLVHGAVNLDNVIINDNGFLLSSFAFSGSDFSKSSKTMIEKEKESTYYLAPELLNDVNKPKTMKSDIWSLGILLFRLMYGRYIYLGNTKNALLNAISSSPTNSQGWLERFDRKDTDFPIQVSNQTELLLGRMLSRNPDERPTFQDLIKSSVFQQIRLTDSEKRQSDAGALACLPAALSDTISSKAQYTFFRESRMQNNIDNYIEEDLYFGVMLRPNNTGKSLCRFKVVKLPVQKIDSYMKTLQQFRQVQLVDTLGRSQTVRFHAIANCLSSAGHLIIVQDYSNQNSVDQYLEKQKINKRHSIFDINGTIVMHRLLNGLTQMAPLLQCHGGLHLKNMYIDRGMVKIGEPLFTGVSQKEIFAEKSNQFDYFAPEFKQHVSQPESYANLIKTDVWTFGILFFKMVYGDIPIFDKEKHPIFPISTQNTVSDRVKKLIQGCLQLNPQQRSEWSQLMTQIREEQSARKYDLTIRPNQEISQLQSKDNEQENLNNRVKSIPPQIQQPIIKQPAIESNSRFFKKGIRNENNLSNFGEGTNENLANESFYNKNNDEQASFNQTMISEHKLQSFDEDQRFIINPLQINQGSKLLTKDAIYTSNQNENKEISQDQHLFEQSIPLNNYTNDIRGLVPSKSSSSPLLRKIKIGIKVTLVLILFFALQFSHQQIQKNIGLKQV